MRLRELAVHAVLFGSLIPWTAASAELTPSERPAPNLQTFIVRGVVRKLEADKTTIVISHEAVPGYMAAMTMPFKVKEPAELKNLETGAQIRFRLQVTGSESWIEGISTIGPAQPEKGKPAGEPATIPAAPVRTIHPLLDFKFTNELGQAVRLSDFRGQALAITFFFTRCPIPDYCPRLSKNFQQASQKLGQLPGAPGNWHFLSVSFDSAFDTPQVLKAYGENYPHDSTRWSFLTGPQEAVNELARNSGLEVSSEAGLFNHNFRTLIIDAAGQLQTTIPIGGDLADLLVTEMLKACAATNEFMARTQTPDHHSQPPGAL